MTAIYILEKIYQNLQIMLIGLVDSLGIPGEMLSICAGPCKQY
jgi:hypothetical protein